MKLNEFTQIEEGPIGDFVDNVKAAAKGAKTAYKTNKQKQSQDVARQIPKGMNIVGLDNKTYVWHGAQWIGPDGKIASKDIAPDLTRVAVKQADNSGGIMKGIGMVGKGLAKGAMAVGRGVKGAYQGTKRMGGEIAKGYKRGSDWHDKFSRNTMLGKAMSSIAGNQPKGIPGTIGQALYNKGAEWEKQVAAHKKSKSKSK